MYHLIYHSQARRTFDIPRLVALLEQCRDNNTRRSITRLMLYTPEGQFMQILEGEDQDVTHLYYDRIARDPRHTNCTVIDEGPWARRSFPGWSMGFLPEESGTLVNTPGYVEFNSLRGLLQKWAPHRPALVHMSLEFIARYVQNQDNEPLTVAP